MMIKLPTWARGITDEGAATFIAFAARIASQYGYDIQYCIHMDDVVKLTNRVPQGMADWLRAQPGLHENMVIGKILDDVMVFSMEAPGKSVTQAELRQRQRRVEQIDFELTQERQKFVWMYILGCLHQDLVTDNDVMRQDYNCQRNTLGIKEFQIDREARGYISAKDRND